MDRSTFRRSRRPRSAEVLGSPLALSHEIRSHGRPPKLLAAIPRRLHDGRRDAIVAVGGDGVKLIDRDAVDGVKK